MKKDISALVEFSNENKILLEERGSEFQTTFFEFVYEAPLAIPLVEMSDEDLLKLAHKHGEFSYLEKPEEDIYTLSDGTPL